jgi:hypothetical protein
VENVSKSSPTRFKGESAARPGAAAVTLTGFSLDVLDAVAPGGDWNPEGTVERAVRRYLDDRALRPPGWACLPLPEPGDRDDAGRPAIDVAIDDSTLSAISKEALTQKVSLEAIVTHAVMYLWASERPSVAAQSGQAGEQEGAAAGQVVRGGATTGVAPSFASDPRRLSRPR